MNEPGPRVERTHPVAELRETILDRAHVVALIAGQCGDETVARRRPSSPDRPSAVAMPTTCCPARDRRHREARRRRRTCTRHRQGSRASTRRPSASQRRRQPCPRGPPSPMKRPDVGRAAEGMHTARVVDDPVAVTLWPRQEVDGSGVHVDAGQRPEELRRAEREHAALGGEQPIAATVGRRCDRDHAVRVSGHLRASRRRWRRRTAGPSRQSPRASSRPRREWARCRRSVR